MCISSIQEQVGNTNKVILGLSCGIETTISAHLIHKAIWDRSLSVI
jgi:GMP synthase PP-ATPase subunit